MAHGDALDDEQHHLERIVVIGDTFDGFDGPDDALGINAQRGWCMFDTGVGVIAEAGEECGYGICIG